MGSEGAMQASEGGKQPSVLPSYDRYMNHNSDQHGIITQRCNSAMYTLAVDQQLSNWAKDPFNKRENLPSIGNLVSYPKLLKSCILEENLNHGTKPA